MKKRTSRFFLPALFLALLTLAACTGKTPVGDTAAAVTAPEAAPETIPETSPETEPPEPLPPFSLDLSLPALGTAETPVVARYRDEAVNTVKAALFGDNLAWRGNGYGVWNEKTGALNAPLVSAIRRCGVTHLRYPGGVEGDYFHWEESIGATRVPQIDPFSSDYPTRAQRAGERYLPTFGFGEFVSLCRALEIPATVQLNAGNGTPEEAAAWVRYCLANGIDVASFSIGNEPNMAAEKVEGLRVTKTPEEYVSFASRTLELLGEDRDRVEIGAVALLSAHPLCKYPAWDKKILTALGDRIDFVDCHLGYAPLFTLDGDSDEEIFTAYMAAPDWIASLLATTEREIDAYAGENAKNISIQITEYGPMGTYYNGTVGSVFLASLLQTMAKDPRISAANHLPMLNHPYAALLVGYYRVNGADHFWDNICSYVFRWYAEQAGREVLAAEETAQRLTNRKKVGVVPPCSYRSGETAVYLDRAARRGTLFLINRDPAENRRFEVALPFEEVTLTSCLQIRADDKTLANTWDRPNNVTPAEVPVGGRGSGEISAILEPISLVRMDFSY